MLKIQMCVQQTRPLQRNSPQDKDDIEDRSKDLDELDLLMRLRIWFLSFLPLLVLGSPEVVQ
jgi:hypothetical protein